MSFCNYSDMSDIDECLQGTHTCDRNLASCNNTEGSFECSCNNGFEGDGYEGTCIGKTK